MKIARVEAVQLSIPFTYGGTRRLAGAYWRALDFCLVRVETEPARSAGARRSPTPAAALSPRR